MIIPISKPEAEQAKEIYIEGVNFVCTEDKIDPEIHEAILAMFTEFCKIIGV
jgi:hypothetical protein